MLRTGYCNFVKKDKVLAITGTNKGGDLPKPIVDLINRSRGFELVIDHTNGKKTRSVIHLTDGYLVLSTITAETLNTRMSV